MDESNTIYLASFKSWKNRNLSEELIKEELLTKGYPENQVADIVLLYKKQCQKQRLFNGSLLIAAGSFLGFLSMVLTLIDFGPEWRDILMYSPTIIGVLIALTGFYLVFERP